MIVIKIMSIVISDNSDNSVQNKKYFSNPIQLNEETIIFTIRKLLTDELIITHKIDGVNKICTYNDKYVFDVEVVDNNIFIIDIIEPKLPNLKTLENRLKYISLLFNKKVLYTESNAYAIRKILEKIHMICECDNYKLFIKPFIKTTSHNKQWIDMLYSTYYPMDMYPNDGFIVYTKINKTDNRYPIKFKPKDKLSIDIKYIDNEWWCLEKKITLKPTNNLNLPLKNNSIYQVNILNNNIIKERTDKNNPNRYRTITDNYNIYQIINLEIFYDNFNNDNYYYSRKKYLLNDNIKSLLKTLKNKSIHKINNILGSFEMLNLHSKIKVIDIGCGNCNIGYKLDKNIQYCGIDSDPYILTSIFKPQDNIYKLNMDFNSKMEEGITQENILIEHFYYKFKKLSGYGISHSHLMICNNSLHYVFNNDSSNDTHEFFKSINSMSFFNTHMYIFNMFSNTEQTIIYDDDFNVKIKKIDNSSNPKMTHYIKYKYPWLGSKINIHRIYSTNYVIEEFENNGWMLKEMTKLTVPDELLQFKNYFDLHKMMIFVKAHN
jgi:hypothetical protein